jgi:ketosteroid isomerase-like protein
MAEIEEVVRAYYRAYEEQDRETLERLTAEGFTFSSPRDDRIDRAEFFERCYPNPDLAGFEFKRLTAIADDEVLVTYELVRKDGTRGRNTEILGVEDGQLTSAEVYFGWDLG